MAAALRGLSDSHLLEWSCAGLVALSAALYLVGRYRGNAKLTRWDALKIFIPPAAFMAWMLVQNPGVFDLWWPGSSTGVHSVIAAFAAVVLGLLASALGYQVDQAPALPIVRGLNPKTGPLAGGTSVTVTGSAFTGATSVSFGQVAAANPVVASDTQLTAASPKAV